LLIRSHDRWGGADNDAEHCLLASLRRLGASLQVDRPGPFWALRDGNTMLLPLGMRLVPLLPQQVPLSGRFVVWRTNHFVAAEVTGAHVDVWDGDNHYALAATKLGEPGVQLYALRRISPMTQTHRSDASGS
jgi:hypothetical protein